MNKDIIRNNYSKMPIEKLIELCGDINGLQSDAILLLQEELLIRDYKNEALKITKHLLSKKDTISEEIIFEYILDLRKKGLIENEIGLPT